MSDTKPMTLKISPIDVTAKAAQYTLAGSAFTCLLDYTQNFGAVAFHLFPIALCGAAGEVTGLEWAKTNRKDQKTAGWVGLLIGMAAGTVLTQLPVREWLSANDNQNQNAQMPKTSVAFQQNNAQTTLSKTTVSYESGLQNAYTPH